MFQNIAILNLGDEPHHLDHLAPLAAWLKIPLITDQKKTYQNAQYLYPDVTCHYIPDLQKDLSVLAREYHCLIVSSRFWSCSLKHLFALLYQKEINCIFCPHGNSDKSLISPKLSPFYDQFYSFTYGRQMEDMIQTLHAPSLKQTFCIGNYRLEYYLQHKQHLDEYIQSILPKTSRKYILYAPTWNDQEHLSTFSKHTFADLHLLTKKYTVLIKLHPYIQRDQPILYYSFQKELETSNHMVLLSDYTPVYPLLKQINLYIGDASSIGYDCLFFQKPMLFMLKPNQILKQRQNNPQWKTERAPLQLCGQIHALGAKNLEINEIEQTLRNPYQKRQQELYQYAFQSLISKKELSLMNLDLFGRKPLPQL